MVRPVIVLVAASISVRLAAAQVYDVTKPPFNAPVNTSQNCSPAINAAIAAAEALPNGGAVYFPPGTYRCNSQLSTSNLPRPLTLVGDGGSSELRKNFEGSSLMLVRGANTSHRQHVVIADLAMSTGPLEQAAGWMIQAETLDHASFRGLRIVAPIGGIEIDNCFDVRLQDIYMRNTLATRKIAAGRRCNGPPFPNRQARAAPPRAIQSI
ncbi:MAG: glycosyl hydrolase family 28-related protein [Phycisphaerae bacterium]